MNATRRLLGTWRTDPRDDTSLLKFGDVSLRFEANGELRYTVHEETKDQIMRLTYRVDGDWLVTDQPSAPREQRTRFSVAADGRLVLENPGGRPTNYVKQ